MSAIEGARILLVEDNKINRKIAVELLEAKGLNVAIAINGRKAVEMAGQSEYDCILMDIQIPIMDGFEATRAIRKEDRFQSLPIIAMTANAMAGDKKRCLDAGMNDYLSKPINPQELYLTLVKWIPARKAEEQETGSSQVLPPAATDENALPELPGIDVSDGLTRVNGKESLYRKLLIMFFKGQSNILETIKKALGDGDTKTANFHVHTIKGVASALGVKRLAESSEPLEAQFRKGEKEIDNVLWEDFSDALEEVLGSLQKLVADEDEGQADPLDFSQIKVPQSLIDEMTEKIKMGKIMELDPNFSELEKIKPNGQKLAKHLKELAENFDINGIMKILEAIGHAS